MTMASLRQMLLILTLCLVARAQQASDEPAANPARPTIATPATLTPVGYLQFESGFLYARDSPEFSSQSSVNEVVKLAVARRLQFIVGSGPVAHSCTMGEADNGTGDLLLGGQGVVYSGDGPRPTVALSYFRRVYEGSAPDLDIGSARNSALLLASAEVRGFHYDANYFVNEVVNAGIHRVQLGQTLSVSHPLPGKFGVTSEIWHFTQPFLRSNAVGNLWALNYNQRRNLVFDAGLDHGLTRTSTHWEIFAGVTYLLPHRLFSH